MPSTNIEILQQLILFFEEYIELETEKEQLTAYPSILLPRLRDGLRRQQEELKRIENR